MLFATQNMSADAIMPIAAMSRSPCCDAVMARLAMPSTSPANETAQTKSQHPQYGAGLSCDDDLERGRRLRGDAARADAQERAARERHDARHDGQDAERDVKH